MDRDSQTHGNNGAEDSSYYDRDYRVKNARMDRFYGLKCLFFFRIFKMARYLREVMVLMHVLLATRHKITVFLMTVLALALILGTLMYVIEGREGGFNSIPAGFYWAIVTLTTIGYGDLAPHTLMGQILTSVAMLLGYSMIIIPVGIFAVEVVKRHGKASRQDTHHPGLPQLHGRGVRRRCRLLQILRRYSKQVTWQERKQSPKQISKTGSGEDTATAE